MRHHSGLLLVLRREVGGKPCSLQVLSRKGERGWLMRKQGGRHSRGQLNRGQGSSNCRYEHNLICRKLGHPTATLGSHLPVAPGRVPAT